MRDEDVTKSLVGIVLFGQRDILVFVSARGPYLQ